MLSGPRPQGRGPFFIRYPSPVHSKIQSPRRLGLSLLLAGLCTGFASAPAAAQPSAEGLAVPQPDLSAMQPAARRRVESLQQALAGLLASSEPQPEQIGQAFGFLGQMFYALELPVAAGEAYAVARRLVPDDARWAYYAGLAAHGRGDLETAVADYRSYLSARPQDLAAHLRLGEALLALDRAEEARVAFSRALEIAGDSAAARYGLGRSAAASGDHRAAVDHFLAVLDLAPTADAAAYQLAQSYRRLGDEERAAGFLGLAGEREPAFPDPLATTLGSIENAIALEVVQDLAAADSFSERDFAGFVRGNLGGVTGAAAAARSAAAGAAEAPAVVRGRLHYAAGLLAAREGDLPAAVEELEAALALAPGLADARLDLANALAGTGRFEAAVDRYGEVLARDPASLVALVQRAAASANLGRFEAARADLDKALELEPGHAEAQLRLGVVLARQGEPEAAAARFAAAAAAGEGTRVEAEAWVALAELARGRGELPDAAAAYRRAIGADPALVPALAGLASLLAETGRYPQAAALYNRLVAIDPGNQAARLSEVTVLILAGQDAAARDRLEAALARDPDDLDLQDVLARHLAAANDRAVRDGARAVELAEKVYAAAPTLASIETLAMAHAEAGDFERAVEWQEKLLARIEEEGEGQAPERLTANLRLYQSRRPCCAGP
jgi:protein O-mannosyl-transferase